MGGAPHGIHSFLPACGANQEMCGDEFQDATWDRKSKDDAVALLASLATFDFFISCAIRIPLLLVRCHREAAEPVN